MDVRGRIIQKVYISVRNTTLMDVPGRITSTQKVYICVRNIKVYSDFLFVC